MDYSKDKENSDACIVQPSQALDYWNAYKKYVQNAAALYFSENGKGFNFAPKMFDYAGVRTPPLTMRIGPINLENPAQTFSLAHVETFMKLVAKAIGNRCEGIYTHNVYAACCAPPEGPGLTTLYVWCPTALFSAVDVSGVYNEVVSVLKAKDSKMFGDTFYINDKQVRKSFTDEFAGLFLEKKSHNSKWLKMIPILWCTDPHRKDILTYYPIVPYVSYAYVTVSDAGCDAEIDTKIELDDCLQPHSSRLFRHVFEKIPQIPYADKDGPRLTVREPYGIRRELGLRGDTPELITYDCLGLVLSSSFAELSQQTVTELPENPFSAMTILTKDTYDIPNTLKLLSAERFDTSTIEGLARSTEIFEALQSYYKSTDLQSSKNSALSAMQTAATALKCQNFDKSTLESQHMANYEGRPSRSRQIISHYARIDNPFAFTQIFFSHIWCKLIQISRAEETTSIAIACAAYLAINHYYLPTKKNEGILYVFENQCYREIVSIPTHITGLLSPDRTYPGALFTMLSKFKARLNMLVDGATANDTNSNSEFGGTEFLRTQAGTIEEILNNLKCTKFKNSLIAEIVTQIHCELTNFIKMPLRKMGDDAYITGVLNGVVEVIRTSGSKKIMWRPATPEDMICTRFNARYDANIRGTRKWTTVIKFFERFISDAKTREWYICQMAEMFVGRNNKIAVFLHGPSDCGKSIHLQIIQDFIGKDLANSAGSNILSDKANGTNTPTPALCTAANGRMFSIEETTGIIENSIYKVITGGSARTAMRTLYDTGSTLTFAAKAYFALNSYPKFAIYEPAIFTRTALIEVDSRFLDISNPLLPKTDAEREAKRIFVKDPLYTSLVRNAYDALLLYLMDHFGAWTMTSTDGTSKPAELSAFPPKIIAAHDKIRSQCPYANFYARNVITGSMQDSKLFVGEAYQRFKAAAKGTVAGISEYSFQISMSMIIGSNPVGEGYWRGYQLASMEDAVNKELTEAVIRDTVPKIGEEEYDGRDCMGVGYAVQDDDEEYEEEEYEEEEDDIEESAFDVEEWQDISPEEIGSPVVVR